MQPASGRRWATFSGLNVGAGAGAYEPRDLEVTAVEPSRVMREQRPPEAVHPLTPEQLGRADPYDCLDGSFHAYWRRPEAYLEPQVRAGSSVFSRLTPREVDDGVARLSADLESGEWQRRTRSCSSSTSLTWVRLLVAG